MTVPSSAHAYYLDTTKRHLLTPQNLAELGITDDKVRSILNDERLKSDNQQPTGLSINEVKFGDFPGETAAERGWMAYMNVGAPLIEERSDLTQPPPDVLSTRAYVNLAGDARQFEDAVNFSISNTISWSIEGTAQLTFGARTSAQLETQIQKSLQNKKSHTDIMHNHKDNVGTETQDLKESTTTDTAIGAARGTSEVFAQLMLGITASVSGSLTTSWTSNSTMSGSVPGRHRVETMATQRRQVKQYSYELPITFAGYVALHYPDPVYVRETPPQDTAPNPTDVIARNIQDIGLIPPGQLYRPKGIAETVSALEVEHTAFEAEVLNDDHGQMLINKQRPHKF